MILQLPVVCTDGMEDIRKYLCQNYGALFFATFDDRPGKLFDELQHIRVAIVTGKKDTEKAVFTSIFNRWYSETRANLFKLLHYYQWKETYTTGSIAKIGDPTLASIIEGHHDDKGIQWPISVAPYQVAIIPIQYKDKMKEVADQLYDELTKAGIEVILDDRNERPGVKFTDSELIGYPVRIVVGDKNLPNVEFKIRTAENAELVPATEAGAKAIQFVKDEFAKLNN